MGVFDAESVILHELGHALGLDHPNLLFEDPEVSGNFVHTSFSAAYDGAPAGVLVGADGIRGSRDDFFDDLFGSVAVNIHWFREDDNDPFVIDETVIDIDSFSRTTSGMLPPGSTWAANANYCHGFQLGHQRTQSVMYSVVSTASTFSGITADDANMVKMQRTGEDRDAATPDDYVAQVNWVSDCLDADIEVRFGPLPTGVPGAAAVHILPTFAEPPPPLARHYTAVPSGSPPPPLIIVTLKEDAQWDFGTIFRDGFESGDTSAWSTVVDDGESDPGGGEEDGGLEEDEVPLTELEEALVLAASLGGDEELSLEQEAGSGEGGGHPYFCPIPPPQ